MDDHPSSSLRRRNPPRCNSTAHGFFNKLKAVILQNQKLCPDLAILGNFRDLKPTLDGVVATIWPYRFLEINRENMPTFLATPILSQKLVLVLANRLIRNEGSKLNLALLYPAGYITRTPSEG